VRVEVDDHWEILALRRLLSETVNKWDDAVWAGVGWARPACSWEGLASV
jgi:hypothetical protein